MNNEKLLDRISSEDEIFYAKMNGTRLERIYKCMHTRCYNEKHRSYRNYGARGIKISDEWLEKQGEINFYKWSLSNGYEDNLTIDRIDPNGNYEPSNCRWSDYKEQNNNKRTTIKVLYNKKEVTLPELSEITGIKRHTLYQRYRRGIKDFSNAI